MGLLCLIVLPLLRRLCQPLKITSFSMEGICIESTDLMSVYSNVWMCAGRQSTYIILTGNTNFLFLTIGCVVCVCVCVCVCACVRACVRACVVRVCVRVFMCRPLRVDRPASKKQLSAAREGGADGAPGEQCDTGEDGAPGEQCDTGDQCDTGEDGGGGGEIDQQHLLVERPTLPPQEKM